MTIRWAPSARQEFDAAIDYLQAHSPMGAHRIGRAILHAIDLLEKFPSLAPPSRHRGLRQKTVPRTPYLIIYRIEPDGVEIRAVIHAKRKRRR
jgi:plasmid stabilization system protein ParE